MKNLVLGSFLAGLILFFWGFVYYGIIGIPYGLLGEVDDIGPVLKTTFPADGTYIVPNPNAENLEELQAQGPIAMIHIKRDGVANPLSMMGTGFVHGWIYCLLLAALLKQICKKSGYGARVGFVTLVGVAGAFMDRFGDAIWFVQSWSWHASNFAYSVIGAALVGLVLAKFIESPVTSV